MLKNKRILVTRTQGQASELTRLLIKKGGRVLEFPTIQIVPPKNYRSLDRAIKRRGGFDWIFFTSVNGVDTFFKRMKICFKTPCPTGQRRVAEGGGPPARAVRLRRMSTMGGDDSAFVAEATSAKEADRTRHSDREGFEIGAKIGAIGSATAGRIRSYGLKVHLVPPQFSAEGIVHELSRKGIKNCRVLIPRARRGREVLIKELRRRRCRVTLAEAYRTIIPKVGSTKLKRIFLTLKPAWVTFASSSTVENFVKILGRRNIKKYLFGTRIACIGPITAKTANRLGLTVDVIPQRATMPDLVNAMEDFPQSPSNNAPCGSR